VQLIAWKDLSLIESLCVEWDVKLLVTQDILLISVFKYIAF